MYRGAVAASSSTFGVPPDSGWAPRCDRAGFPRQIVNNTVRPSGRNSGHRCSNSVGCGVVRTSAVPPAAGVRYRPPPAKTMTSPGPQAAPKKRPVGDLPTVPTSPPSNATRLISPPAADQNPTDLPSGEKKGWRAPSVPGIGRTSMSHRRAAHTAGRSAHPDVDDVFPSGEERDRAAHRIGV